MAQRQFSQNDTSTWTEQYGDGSAGALTISADTTDSARSGYANTTISANLGSTSATAGSGTGFAANDLILIYQSRNGGTGVGNWELNKISSVGGGTNWTLAYATIYAYDTTAQVYRLVQNGDITIDSTKTLTGVAWDGTKGGVVALLSNGTITVTGVISLNSKGFRGGIAVSGSAVAGYQGEGVSGASAQTNTANGNGGGGGRTSEGGGAGGGNGAAGGLGEALSGDVGATAGNVGLTVAVFGGGGGSGATGGGGGTSGVGGLGGGLVVLIGKTITVTGGITAIGADGGTSTTGSGGGGAGGSVLIKGQTITLGSTLVVATGGAFGNSSGIYDGGAGGTGRIHADYAVSISGTTSPTLDSIHDSALLVDFTTSTSTTISTSTSTSTSSTTTSSSTTISITTTTSTSTSSTTTSSSITTSITTSTSTSISTSSTTTSSSTTTTKSTSTSTTISTSTTTTIAPPSDTSYLFDGSTVTDNIEILMPDGFQVGNSARVNSNNIDYYYFAFAKGVEFFDIGSYTGNGVNNFDIGTIFTPIVAWIQKTSGADAEPVWSTNISVATDSTLRFGNSAVLTTAILDLASIGLGTHDTVNTNGASYSYFIWKNPQQVTVAKKYYQYKVYNSGIAGSYLTTWTPYEILTEPSFRNVINGGPGEVVIRLARNFDDFGEDVDVKLNNRVDIWVYDREAPQGLLFYKGFISGYRPVLDGNKEFVEVTLLSYIFELGYYMLRDGSGNTKITYNSQDPSTILQNIIDFYKADGGTISYSATSIATTGTTVSYVFNTNTVREALDKVIELAPIGWYWYIDSQAIIHFASKSVVADHTFVIGTHITQLETFRRIEDVVNRVYFTGFTTASGTGLYRVYSNSGSITSYGLHAINKVDGRVTQTGTADTMANRILNDKINPEIRTSMILADSNGDNENRGYDIESIQPGQTMKIRNIKQGTKTYSRWDQAQWDVDIWDATLATTAADIIQILSVDYSPDALRLEASSRLPEISKRIEDIERNRVTEIVNLNPTIPVAG